MSEERRGGTKRPSDSTPGEILQQRRERAGLSIERAAQDLHLDTWVIEAIETNHFSALGAPVFAKGHLRKYAALLGVAPEEVLRRYANLAEGDETPSLIPAAHGTVHEPPTGWSRWVLAGLAVLVVAALAVWWMLAPDARNPPAEPSGGRATAVPSVPPAVTAPAPAVAEPPAVRVLHGTDKPIAVDETPEPLDAEPAGETSPPAPIDESITPDPAAP